MRGEQEAVVDFSTATATLAQLLQEGMRALQEQGLPSVRHEAEILLCQTLSLRRMDLWMTPDRPVATVWADAFMKKIARRCRHEPLEYIVGEVEFCGMALGVGPGVFIPRPETEFIVEAALRIRHAPLRILDLCTGSGALAIALARRFPKAMIVAVDICPEALSFARLNLRHLCASSQIQLIAGNLFSPLKEGACFDLMVSNPPYVAVEDWFSLAPNVRNYEPRMALLGGTGGLDFYRRILGEAAAYLTPQGVLILEIGDRQAAAIRQVAGDRFMIDFIPDLSGTDRVAICRIAGKV